MKITITADSATRDHLAKIIAKTGIPIATTKIGFGNFQVSCDAEYFDIITQDEALQLCIALPELTNTILSAWVETIKTEHPPTAGSKDGKGYTTHTYRVCFSPIE